MKTPREELATSWDPTTLDLALETRFRCAYCEKDFFASVDDYYSLEVEHIVPISKGGPDSPENKTVVCSTCNFLKSGWDPRSETGDNASRSAMLEAAKQYVAQRRTEMEEKVAREKRLAETIMDRRT